MYILNGGGGFLGVTLEVRMATWNICEAHRDPMAPMKRRVAGGPLRWESGWRSVALGEWAREGRRLTITARDRSLEISRTLLVTNHKYPHDRLLRRDSNQPCTASLCFSFSLPSLVTYCIELRVITVHASSHNISVFRL